MSNPENDLRQLADRYADVDVTISFGEAVDVFLFAAEFSDYLNSRSAESFASKITGPVIDKIIESQDRDSLMIIFRSVVGEM